ncbi:hypothetical protein SLE2022_323990 [Rubroshorea leprosula]
MENTTFLNSSTDIVLFTALALSFSCFLLFVFNKLMQRQANEKPSRLPLSPGLKPWPILGNLPEMLWYKPFFRWIHNYMKQIYTDIGYIRLGNVHVITVTCPEIACKFLVDQDAVFASRPICMSAEWSQMGTAQSFLSPLETTGKRRRES